MGRPISVYSHGRGAKIHYTTGGQGPAVLLLHGYAETSRMWMPILPVLGEKFTVIAPDLPGIGESSIPADGVYIEARRSKSLAPLPSFLRQAG